MSKADWWMEHFIDNPDSLRGLIVPPEDHEEYLNQPLLYCLFRECEWTGKSLSGHLLQTHRVRPRAFKIAAGFNVTRGLICKSTREKQQDSPIAIAGKEGAFVGHLKKYRLRHGTAAKREDTRTYKSTVSRKKAKKWIGKKVEHKCEQCGVVFVVKNRVTKARFCSVSCRNRYHYYDTEGATSGKCCECGKAFKLISSKRARADMGLVVFCSRSCSQTNNGRSSAA